MFFLAQAVKVCGNCNYVFQLLEAGIGCSLLEMTVGGHWQTSPFMCILVHLRPSFITSSFLMSRHIFRNPFHIIAWNIYVFWCYSFLCTYRIIEVFFSLCSYITMVLCPVCVFITWWIFILFTSPYNCFEYVFLVHSCWLHFMNIYFFMSSDNSQWICISGPFLLSALHEYLFFPHPIIANEYIKSLMNIY